METKNEERAAIESAYASVLEGGWGSVKDIGIKMFQAGAAWQRAQSAGVPDVSAMAKVLSDRVASACCVDPDDNWAMYGQEYIEDVQAMLAAAPTVKAEQGAVPDGYALVPVEPTPAMRVIGARDCSSLIQPDHAGEVWRAMLGAVVVPAEYAFAAAPAHPAERQEVVYLSEEAASTLRGMVEYCLNQRVCLGMDEGFASFEPEIEHDFVKELRAFAESAAPFALLPEVQRLRVAQWTTQKPTEPGAYWIRGFRLFEPESAPALVEVADDGGELVCNLHESNSQDSLRMWSPVADFNEEFEWLGPLQALAASTGQEVEK